MTRNTTIAELYGDYHNLDIESTANKEQQRPLTRDTLRHEVKCTIESEFIESDSNIVSKTNYNLSNLNLGDDAVIYRNMKTYFKPGDNISFNAWFKIHTYFENETYTLFNYYDEVNKNRNEDGDYQ